MLANYALEQTHSQRGGAVLGNGLRALAVTEWGRA